MHIHVNSYRQRESSSLQLNRKRQTKLQNDYEKACQKKEFAQNYQDSSRIRDEDGKYDRELDIETQAYQWFDPKYRKGYFAGVTNRFNELFDP